MKATSAVPAHTAHSDGSRPPPAAAAACTVSTKTAEGGAANAGEGGSATGLTAPG